MQTDALIDELVRDLRPCWSLTQAYRAGIVAGVALAALLFLATLGPRPDVHQALATLRFPLKFVETATLAAAALMLLVPLSRPGADLGARPALLLFSPVLLGLAVLGELHAVPADTWGPRLIGSNAGLCLMAIPLLALGPLAGLLACLRYGAPTRPGLAGAVAGLAASGIGATFYAAHCPDDSPLFVATWYVLATGLVTAIGLAAGRLLPRW